MLLPINLIHMTLFLSSIVSVKDGLSFLHLFILLLTCANSCFFRLCCRNLLQ